MPEKSLTYHDYSEYIEKDLSTPYLIDPILPRGGIGLVYGKGGHGKTQLVLSIIKSMAEGSLLFGLWPVQKGRILFIQGDMPQSLFQERLARAEPAFDNTADIKISHTDPMDITDTGWQRALSEAVEDVEPDLVIYDTLHKLHYLDEIDSVSSRKVYGSWKRAVGEDITTIFLHHSRKDMFNPKAGKYVGSSEDFRGHTSWRDDSDLAMRVRKDKDSAKETQLDFTRLRCDKQPSLTLRFDPETLLLEPDPSSLKAETLAMRFLKNGGTREELVEYLSEDFGFTERHAYRVKKALTW